MLVKGQISKELFTFVKNQNESVQEDADKAMQDFCNKIEEVVFNAIKSASITLQPGIITVLTAQGPAANVTPIQIEESIV